MATTYTLFPPVIDTYTPAFILEDLPTDKKKIKVNERFYFKISQFNTHIEIGASNNNTKDYLYAAIELTLKDTQTNKYVLNNNITDNQQLKSIILNAYYDTNLQSYYVNLPFNRLFSGREYSGRLFNLSSYKYYQMQMRFISRGIVEDSTELNKIQALFLESNYYNNNDERIYYNNGIDNQYLSEWSSVCLIRPIEEPQVKLTIPRNPFAALDEDTDKIIISDKNDEGNPREVNDPDVSITGMVTFPNSTDAKVKEYLKSYQVQFYLENGVPKQDSGIIEISNNSNQFVYPIEYLLLDKSVYKIKILFTTNNLYSFSTDFIYIKANLKSNIQDGYLNFLYPNGYILEEKSDGTIGKVDVNKLKEEELKDKPITLFHPVRMGVNNTGEIDLLMYWNTYVNLANAKLTIYRTDLRSGFLHWEKILNTDIPLGLIGSRYAFNDTTAEDGIWYKYAARIRTGENYEQYSDTIYAYNLINSYTEGLDDDAYPPIMSVLDNMYLISENHYLTIKLNPTVNSFKVKTIDSITETLGSKYPFVRRNGTVNYRQLQIGGLISRHMDENQRFADNYDLYNKYTYLYQRYNEEYNINEYNDYVYERVFREKVIEFLHNGKPKLLRSPTEGVLLVKLTDITLTPNQQLGRMIYSFSATATEIDECNIDNFIKYDILDLEKGLGYFFVPVLGESGTGQSPDKNYAENNFIYNNFKIEHSIFCPATYPETDASQIQPDEDQNVVYTGEFIDSDGNSIKSAALNVYENHVYHSSLESITPF